jgi:hypothetical protein
VKYNFEENAEKFSSFDTDEDQAGKIKCLHDNFCQLLDRIVMAKKSNWSEDHLEGVLPDLKYPKKYLENS